MNTDEQQLDLLGIFHYVVGGLMALFACLPFIHFFMGLAIATGAFDGGKNGPPAFIGVFFMVFAGFFILAGWALAVVVLLAGRQLRQRRARTFCLVVAALECLFMPFGTVLGVFTIVVLMKEPVIVRFAANDGHPTGAIPLTPPTIA